MTVLAVLTLTCDGCGTALTMEATSIRSVRRHAALVGWHQHTKRTRRGNRNLDLCPACPHHTQARPRCPVCGVWERRDHRCAGAPSATPRPASTRRLPKLVHP